MKTESQDPAWALPKIERSIDAEQVRIRYEALRPSSAWWIPLVTGLPLLGLYGLILLNWHGPFVAEDLFFFALLGIPVIPFTLLLYVRFKLCVVIAYEANFDRTANHYVLTHRMPYWTRTWKGAMSDLAGAQVEMFGKGVPPPVLVLRTRKGARREVLSVGYLFTAGGPSFGEEKRVQLAFEAVAAEIAELLQSDVVGPMRPAS